MATLAIGQKAPSFELPGNDDNVHALKDYLGQWVLIYFYPKDNTTGCTKQACSIRDSFPNFRKLNITVLGISKDSVASHKKFAQKYELPFLLLADESTYVMNIYGAWGKKKFLGKEYMGTLRNSYLVDPVGTIVKIYEGVKPEFHAEEVLSDLKELKHSTS